MEPLAPTQEFLDACSSFGIECEPDELTGLGVFLARLLEANNRVNLTAIRDPDKAWMRHIFDALTILSVLGELPGGSAVADVGTGGGVPAIPLAITRPDWNVTCIESTGKKCEFLRQIAGEMELANVRVVQDRAEAIGRDPGFRESFDAVLARAVGRMRILAEYTIPLAKPDGLIVLTKGERAREEIEEAHQALYLLHADVGATVSTPTGTLVVLHKTRKTPAKYPRAIGEPTRDPLG
ncbi:MAG: 16S rRNA (guanine(527)-N(7))-methyltransferase RsmG [Phycisphaerales bacterium JB043]